MRWSFPGGSGTLRTSLTSRAGGETLGKFWVNISVCSAAVWGHRPRGPSDLRGSDQVHRNRPHQKETAGTRQRRHKNDTSDSKSKLTVGKSFCDLKGTDFSSALFRFKGFTYKNVSIGFIPASLGFESQTLCLLETKLPYLKKGWS